eukprot:432406_1
MPPANKSPKKAIAAAKYTTGTRATFVSPSWEVDPNRSARMKEAFRKRKAAKKAKLVKKTKPKAKKRKRSKKSSKKGSKKAKKDPNAPKKPLSAYMCFAKAKRPDITKKNPSLKITEVAKAIGAMWGALADKDKVKYQAEATKDKSRYEAQKKNYVPKPGAAKPAKKSKKSKKSPKKKSSKKPKKSPKKKASKKKSPKKAKKSKK